MMKRFWFVLAFFLLFHGATAQTSSAVAAHPHTYAVIVGISRYDSANKVPWLNFADKDAESFAAYLQSAAGGNVPADNIRLFTNQQADLATIYQSFEWLKETAAANDLVYIYFAGHGDKTNDVVSLGYLLAYNSPLNNYPFQTLRIEDLNNTANTLSVRNNCNVVLITDACHSGDLTSKYFQGTMLLGDALRTAVSKEVRITSCDKNQLSAEDKAWGGGHGVFTWYLVNGLRGLADAGQKGTVTVQDIKQYLDSSFAADATLKENNLKQNPVITGNTDFLLARPDKNALPAIAVSMAAAPSPAVMTTTLRALPPGPGEYVLRQIQGIKPEETVNFFRLDSLPREEIAISWLEQMVADSVNPESVYRNNFLQFINLLKKDPRQLKNFNNKLVQLIHKRGQDVINLYLNADEAELERRRYYNSRSNNYDVYPRMFSVAAKLTADSSFRKVLEMDQHYFGGVAARIKIPLTGQPGPLIDNALAEERMASQLDANAPYVLNELGILHWYKNDFKNAENYLLKAAEAAPQWAIPWSNLCGLYTAGKKFEAALQAGKRADSLQPGLQNTTIQFGTLYEAQNDLLLAEEYYRHGIEINQRHYLPFERLGYVYTRTADYAMADSLFFEAELRKKGYHFNETLFGNTTVLGPRAEAFEQLCPFDPSQFLKDDQMAFFYWGMQSYEKKDLVTAKMALHQVIAIDTANPLVFHYLGKIACDEHNWAQAELFFKLALQKFKNDSALNKYCDSLVKDRKYPYDHSCMEQYFRQKRYPTEWNDYFLASVFEQWQHLPEAEAQYDNLIKRFPADEPTWIKYWTLLEKQNQYTKAEKLIEAYYVANPTYHDMPKTELAAFYKRAAAHFPHDPQWPLKLGLFFYHYAQAPAVYLYLDTIVEFPLLRKTLFIDKELHNKIIYDNSYSVDNIEALNLARIEKENRIRLMPVVNDPFKRYLPGTGEAVEVACEFIFTPRKEAIDNFSKALDHILDVEQAADINYKIGQVYTWAGSKKMAEPYFVKAVEAVPDNAGYRMDLVEINRYLYHNRQALAGLEYLYQHQQLNFTQGLLLAKMYAWKNNADMARKLFDSCAILQSYPTPALKKQDAQLAAMAGHKKEAVSLFKNYLQQQPHDPLAAYSLCRLYAGVNNTEALNWLKKALLNGFGYYYVLTNDPQLASLRKMPGWVSLLQQMPHRKYYHDLYEEQQFR